MLFHKFKYLFLAVFLASGAAYASVRCVALDSNTTCTAYSANGGSSVWSATCGGIQISGVYQCGKISGVSAGYTVESFSVDGNTGHNTACFCKMVAPVASKWVFKQIHSSGAGDCAYWCQSACAGSLVDASNADNLKFRKALLGSIGQ